MRVSVGTSGDAEVLGFAVAGPNRDAEPACDQELYALNVLPRAEGRGLGAALVDTDVEPGACSLWVVVGNERAIGFYARRGFLPDGSVVRDDRLGVSEQRMVRPVG